MFRKKRSSRSGYFIGSLVGTAVGVAGYYLLASERGSQLRNGLVNKMPEANSKKSGALSHLLLEFGSEWSEDIKEVLSDSKKPEQMKNQSAGEQSEIGELIQGVLEEE
ncbi:YtxH domain-containing protein [Alkalihalophilus marmarensis]|jgi:gas vesicle protein|uniref:YtxH-like protein n=1 Tax=Alkalihalophilus marmarensis DSM 21297 TaxID=1188261 RepID=U6SMK4_9BACI|nr:YtxH domain-containing protein [Alkalihalophilus marmarensis]ERN52949.1 hypothetical protein A33I_13365 [Alkalihalophilus marmarensis DSM 21297]MCM3488946.1 YtxH domain-containing protein [Alkalihalophilus marmarensis]